MDSNLNTTEQDFYINEAPIEKKLKRRSSIFRPEATEMTTFRYHNNVEEFPPSYIEKLNQENAKWNEAYCSIRAECWGLRQKVKQCASDVTITNLFDYEQYFKNVEDFFGKMYIITQLHKHITTMRSRKQNKLNYLLKFTHMQIQKDLNMDSEHQLKQKHTRS